MKTPISLLPALYCFLLLWVTACKKDPDPTPTPGGGTTTPGSGTTTTTKSSAKAITAFAFNALSPAVAATIDATAKTISVTVTSGTDVTKLVPTLTISDKATVSPASGVAQDFTKDITYTVTAEDGSTKTFTMKAATDSYYFANIRMTVKGGTGSGSLNDSCLLNVRTGSVYMLKDGAANAANVDFILHKPLCDLQFYTPAAIIKWGMFWPTDIVIDQKWASYRKGFIDKVSENQVKAGVVSFGQIAATEWSSLNFAADITKQFSVGRKATLPESDIDNSDFGITNLVKVDNNCTPVTLYDQVLYRFLTQDGKKGLMRVNKFGTTASGGYYVIIDIKIEK